MPNKRKQAQAASKRKQIQKINQMPQQQDASILNNPAITSATSAALDDKEDEPNILPQGATCSASTGIQNSLIQAVRRGSTNGSVDMPLQPRDDQLDDKATFLQAQEPSLSTLLEGNSALFSTTKDNKQNETSLNVFGAGSFSPQLQPQTTMSSSSCEPKPKQTNASIVASSTVTEGGGESNTKVVGQKQQQYSGRAPHATVAVLGAATATLAKTTLQMSQPMIATTQHRLACTDCSFILPPALIMHHRHCLGHHTNPNQRSILNGEEFKAVNMIPCNSMVPESPNITISQMRGDNTITETTASVSNFEGGLRREALIERDEEVKSEGVCPDVGMISYDQNDMLDSNWTGVEASNILQENDCDSDSSALSDEYASQLKYKKKYINKQLDHVDAAQQSRKLEMMQKSKDNIFEVESLDKTVRTINGETIHNKHIDHFVETKYDENLCANLSLGSEIDVSLLNQQIQQLLQQKHNSFFGDKENDDGQETKPVLGLNLEEYFQKLHLVDQLPDEPLPPIEHPLVQMTKNHADWVRGQEDFKINLSHKQALNDKNKLELQQLFNQTVREAFHLEAWKDIENLQEKLRSGTFDIRSWETLTQAHDHSQEVGKIEEQNLILSQTHNEEEMKRLLDIEIDKIASRCSQSHLISIQQQDRGNTENHLENTMTNIFNHTPQKLLECFDIDHISHDKLATQVALENSNSHANNQASQATAVEGVYDKPRPRLDLEEYIPMIDLKQILSLEISLQKLLQESSIADFMIPNNQKIDFDLSDEDESFVEPMAPQIGGSLKNMETFLIRGDLRRCVICNSKYDLPEFQAGIKGNYPRVLYCGDCICENCITKQIQRASITDQQNYKSVAACQVICPICDVKHIFKLTKTGYLVCNDKYIKVEDEDGPVNFFPSSQVDKNRGFKMDKEIQLMDNSVMIPPSLVLRSLPINQELVDLIKQSPQVRQSPSQIELSNISETLDLPELPNPSNYLFETSPVESFSVEEFIREYEQEVLQKLQDNNKLFQSKQLTNEEKNGDKICGQNIGLNVENCNPLKTELIGPITKKSRDANRQQIDLEEETTVYKEATLDFEKCKQEMFDDFPLLDIGEKKSDDENLKQVRNVQDVTRAKEQIQIFVNGVSKSHHTISGNEESKNNKDQGIFKIFEGAKLPFKQIMSSTRWVAQNMTQIHGGVQILHPVIYNKELSEEPRLSYYLNELQQPQPSKKPQIKIFSCGQDVTTSMAPLFSFSKTPPHAHEDQYDSSSQRLDQDDELEISNPKICQNLTDKDFTDSLTKTANIFTNKTDESKENDSSQEEKHMLSLPFLLSQIKIPQSITQKAVEKSQVNKTTSNNDLSSNNTSAALTTKCQLVDELIDDGSKQQKKLPSSWRIGNDDVTIAALEQRYELRRDSTQGKKKILKKDQTAKKRQKTISKESSAQQQQSLLDNGTGGPNTLFGRKQQAKKQLRPTKRSSTFSTSSDDEDVTFDVFNTSYPPKKNSNQSTSVQFGLDKMSGAKLNEFIQVFGLNDDAQHNLMNSFQQNQKMPHIFDFTDPKKYTSDCLLKDDGQVSDDSDLSLTEVYEQEQALIKEFNDMVKGNQFAVRDIKDVKGKKEINFELLEKEKGYLTFEEFQKKLKNDVQKAKQNKLDPDNIQSPKKVSDADKQLKVQYEEESKDYNLVDKSEIDQNYLQSEDPDPKSIPDYANFIKQLASREAIANTNSVQNKQVSLTDSHSEMAKQIKHQVAKVQPTPPVKDFEGLDDVQSGEDEPVSAISQIDKSQQLSLIRHDEDSVNKKKAKRNKKRKKKQQALAQANQMEELQHCHKVSDSHEVGLFSMLVPTEESLLLSGPTVGQVRVKQVLASVDYFHYNQKQGPHSVAPKCHLTIQEDGPTNYSEVNEEEEDTIVFEEPSFLTSITCVNCSNGFPVNILEKVSIGESSKAQSQAKMQDASQYVYPKAVASAVKELIDQGLVITASHYCVTCHSKRIGKIFDNMQLKIDPLMIDIKKLCLLCAIEHRCDNSDHKLVLLISQQQAVQLLKKSEPLEYKVRKAISKLQVQTAECQLDVQTLQILKVIIQDLPKPKPDKPQPEEKQQLQNYQTKKKGK